MDSVGRRGFADSRGRAELFPAVESSIASLGWRHLDRYGPGCGG